MLGNLLRSMIVGLAVLAQPGEFPLERQILWQRSLEDALALSKAEHRPLLVVVNMDGESASERIVRERYRDPAFVASTRSFVCVVASPFRHAGRDHDDLGRRIPCPRLGEVTCGEHIALEPILFERFLGGERIAPRHAVVLEDGTKSFDLFLLFDFRDLDRKLAEAAAQAPRASEPPAAPVLAGSAANAASWHALAGARWNRGRSAFEETLLDPRSGGPDESACAAAVQAIGARGDQGSIDAIRILLARRPAPSAALLERVAVACEGLRVEGPAAAAIRERVAGLGAWPGAAGLDADGLLLPLLARLDTSGAASRSLLLAYAALGSAADAERASSGLARALPPAEGEQLAAAIRTIGQRPDVERWLAALREAGSGAAARNAAPPKPAEVKRTAEELERELTDLDRALGERPEDKELLARYGRALLELSQRRMETGGSGGDLLLKDAATFLDRASKAGKRDSKLLFDRAKAAYLAGDYAEEERIALAAEASAEPADRIEAERWVGDAAARLLAARSGGDPVVEVGGILRGARALLEVAASASADATDWESLGSFLGALGMRREEAAVLQLGAEGISASATLRGRWNACLASAGRIDLAPAKAEWIAARGPGSAESAWFAGHAHLLVGENARREEAPAVADAEYRKGETWFLRAIEMRPDFRESTDPYRALCALGRGFAHLLADRRAEAAKCLVEAVGLRIDISGLRDGLDREAVDLLDGALEWRESGASPVDVTGLVDALERAAPGDATWIRAVSDSELREALRADGRGEIVEGDRYLRVSIEAGQRALGISADEDTKRALAQSLAIQAERTIARGDIEGARRPLAEAAALLDEAPPAEDAEAAVLQALAARLREVLGEARPRFRPGR